MSSPFSRRTFLAGAAGVAGAGLLGACGSDDSAGSSSVPTTSAGGGATVPPTSAATNLGTMALQSNQSNPEAKAGMEALVAGFNALGIGEAELNTVAGEQFRTQLTSYLTSTQPPDVLTWLAGKVARDYAADGLLLDVSDVWASDMTGYSDALRKLSTDANGAQIFVPQYYYWWAVYYRPSKFEEWGVEPPSTWEEYVALCQTLDGQGVAPIGMGLSDTPWVASAWFDYLNIRLNGAPFHLDVLVGNERFDDPRVKAVFEPWREILPYIDPNAVGLAFQEAQTQFFQGNSGTFLAGSWFPSGAPEDISDDIDFFQFPILDASVPVGEEAPTDGFFASANAPNPELAKEFLRYASTAAAQEEYLTVSGNSFLPAAPDGKAADTPANAKGKALLESAADLTQFFNRDGGDELQPTADAALLRFFNEPDNVDAILVEWQEAAERARRG
jgi:multiple sugar transport system substrate-binding protein